MIYEKKSFNKCKNSSVKLVFICILSTILIVSTACIKNPSKGDKFPFATMHNAIPNNFFVNADATLDKYTIPKNVTDNCITNLYLDATKSMEGFVNLNKPGLYEQVIQKLSEISYITFKNSSFKYYKFWEKPSPITKEQFRKDAFSSSFYSSKTSIKGNDVKQTNLTNIFKAISIDYEKQNQKTQENQLSIIVTDMVSTSKSDRDDVVKIINDSFLRKGLAVSIIGVKSSFNGKVYDIVANGQTNNFNYVGLRPFYLVIIGSIPNVKAYLNEYTASTKVFIPANQVNKLIIFSKILNYNDNISISNFKFDEQDQAFTKPEDYSQMFTKNLLNNKSIQKIERFSLFSDLTTEIPDKTSLNGILTLNNPYDVDPESSLQIKEWIVKSSIKMISGVEIDSDTGIPYKDVINKEIVENPEQIMIANENMTVQKNNASAQVSFNINKMVKDQIYLANIEVYAQPVMVAKDMPKWIREWTMNFNNYESWLKAPKTFQGQTTPYLENIVETLLRKVATDSQNHQEMKLGEYSVSFISCEPTSDEFRDNCLSAVDSIKKKNRLVKQIMDIYTEKTI